MKMEQGMEFAEIAGNLGDLVSMTLFDRHWNASKLLHHEKLSHQQDFNKHNKH